MNRISGKLSAILLGAVFLMSFAVSNEASPSGPTLPQSLVEGNTVFAVQLYHELSATKGNLFFSAYSVSSALAMTYAGARGNTEKEMKEVLHFGLAQDLLHPAFKTLNDELTAGTLKAGQKLNIANALILTGGNVSGRFKTILQSNYGAEIFSGGLETINGWVKGKTEGKIDKILTELDPNSVCVLLNAVYFKGVWESQFQKNRTRDAPFTISAAVSVKVPLMYQKGDFKLLAEKHFQAVSIPYKGKSLSMVILLPENTDGLAGFEKELTTPNLKGWLEQLDNQPVRKIELYVPKFKVDAGYDLVSTFKKMGIKDAFSLERADFGGMGAMKGDIFISQIKHKAFVEVNEEGTEAAAATAVEMAGKSVSILDCPVFKADHPFLFIIRDNRSGTILFLGRMNNPHGKS